VDRFLLQILAAVTAGVSAGSLNTAIVTGFAIGDEKNMVEYASELFSNTANSDAYQMWKLGGLVRGLTDKSGMLDNAPAYALVNRIVNDLGESKRKWTVSSVDVNTGSYYLMNDTLPREDHARAFLASTLIPGVFEPDNWGKAVLMDGGTVYNTNLVSAVQQCREQVDDDS
jgi:predicted acylesterase/phospholipase RssA